jgi:2-amino-4-hydroxy-6-hydroxymethyldihydropteridine diphosphokinase
LHRGYLGAGSRDGDRLACLREALRLLTQRGVEVVAASSLYETQPVRLPEGPPLVNGAVEIATRLAPEALLEACLEVETMLGRRRAAVRPDPGLRPIDLDLLLLDNMVVLTRDLELPHPRMHERRFVLVPLAEIAPQTLHPVLGETILRY